MSFAAAAPVASGKGIREATAARAIVIATLSFNCVLSFVNASVIPVSAAPVIATELVLIGIAAAMTFNRDWKFPAIAFVLVAWLSFAMMMRYQFDAKVLRDGFIPIVFFFLGRHYGSPASGDRLVTIVILIVVVGALFEWLFLDLFLKYFDVIGYYMARGSVAAGSAGDGPGLFISGLRFEGRTLLPFLGEHRVSSIFLEPVSLGNFGAIVFAWVLLRDRQRPLAMIGKTFLIALILILGDARFGIYLCGVVLLSYLVAPLIRPVLIFALPFLAVVGLLWYAASMVGVAWDNTTTGRFLLSGQLLSTLDLSQAFGLQPTNVDFNDSGYSYMLSQFGLPGAALLWSIYVFGSGAETPQAWRFKLFVCLYLILLLAISTSSVTIKTGALLWFLAGSIAQGAVAAPRRWRTAS